MNMIYVASYVIVCLGQPIILVINIEISFPSSVHVYNLSFVINFITIM